MNRTLSVAEARALDRDAVERLGMPSVLLMENAARGVAAAARALGPEDPGKQSGRGPSGRREATTRQPPVAASAAMGAVQVVLCGPGNNGGDGLAAARHLGPGCVVFLLAEPDPQRAPDAALQLRILRAAGRAIRTDDPRAADFPPGTVWIDALFGTGLRRAPDGRAAAWIAELNSARGPRLAVDVPSGLDADSGVPLGEACVRADLTVTFEAPKTGLVQDSAKQFVGRIEVVPLGLP